MIELTLPFPPSVNQYYRHIVLRGQPRTLISQDGRTYQSQVSTAWKKLQAVQRCPFQPLECRLVVTVNVYSPDRRKRDLDNLGKSLLDAMTKARIWVDDSQIDRLSFERREVVSGGYVRVEISEIPTTGLKGTP